MAFGQHRFAFAGKDAHVVVTRTRSMQRARFGTLTVHKSDRAHTTHTHPLPCDSRERHASCMAQAPLTVSDRSPLGPMHTR